MNIAFVISGILSVMSVMASAEVQNGYRCATTQVFTWPVKTPAGTDVEHTVRVTMESYSDNDYQAKISAAQSAWKVCRQTLGQKFNEDWRALGFESAPKPIDEFGEQRPPKICIDIYKRPDLFECLQVSRQAMPGEDPFVLVEATILK